MPDFFEPVDLRGQPADLGVQFVQFLFVLSVGSLGALLIEESWHILERLGFPKVKLIGMHAMRDRAFFLEQFEYDLRLESR